VSGAGQVIGNHILDACEMFCIDAYIVVSQEFGKQADQVLALRGFGGQPIGPGACRCVVCLAENHWHLWWPIGE
jgi:hypothetical protein